jgi:hypothetical protein
MHSALTVLWIIADLVTLAATIVAIVELRRAPGATKDERDFHPRSARAESRKSPENPVPAVRPGHVRLA